MLKEKLMEQLRNDNHYTIPKYVLTYAKDLNLDMNSLLLLIYLINNSSNPIFDYKGISKDINLNEEEFYNSITSLKEKKILSIEMVKNEAGILEEKINIDSFYDIIFSKMLEDKSTDEGNSDLFDLFEKEFGRTLSPMEYEIINSWVESKIDKGLIISALKEAVFNGVNNLRYIDKILYEWNKKGIKRTDDLDRKIKEEESKEDNTELYEYDWLNE
ncbi:MAG: DnaD domain protein [Tenericutes bacterium]|nr:DnaD domain protein [Mycoplasmatota bacterium]